jgi:outer membrane protein assembly factor BamB/tetratricopeptide (TPR) repeat protein
MSFKGDLSTIGLAEVFQMISMAQKEGTLVVQDPDSRKCIFFGATGVQLVSSGRRKGLKLGDMLLRAGRISEAQLEEALENARILKKLVGEVLVENGVVSQEEIQRVVREQIEEEIYDLFLWKKANFEFIEGPVPENLKDPDAHVTKLTFDVNGLLLEAVRRADEWTVINQHVPSIDSVFTFVSESDRAEEDRQAGDHAKRIYRLLDGRLSAAELVDNTGVSKFEVCKVLVDLVQRGRIRLLSVQEQVEEAQRRMAEGQRDRGLKMYMAAAAQPPPDPKVIGQVARFLEAEGLTRDASNFHVRASNVYLELGDLDRALDHVQRAMEINPDDPEIRRGMFEVHAASGNLVEGKKLARELIVADLMAPNLSRARELCERLIKADPADLDFHVLRAKALHRANQKADLQQELEYINQNLPVNPQVLERIQKDLREIAAKSPTSTRGQATPAAKKASSAQPAPASKKGGSRSLLVGSSAVLVLALGGGLFYEFTQGRQLAGVAVVVRRSLDASEYAEARRLVDEFMIRTLSPVQKEKAAELLREVEARRGAAEKARKDREDKELAQLQVQMKALEASIEGDRRLDPGGALASARKLRELAEKAKDEEYLRKAEDFKLTLEKFLGDAFQLKALADAAEQAGKFREAALQIDRLVLEYPNTEPARSAMYPLEIVTRPPGVNVSTRTGLVLGTSPLKHRMKPGESVRLFFEKQGYATVEREVKDKTLGTLNVALGEKKELWVQPLGLTGSGDPLFLDGDLFVAGGSRFYAFKTASKRLDWFESFDGTIEGNLKSTSKRILAATQAKILYSIDPKRMDRRVAWRYDSGDRLGGTPGLSGDAGTIFVGSYDRNLHAVHATLGDLLWKRELPGEMRQEPLWANGAIIVPCQDGSLIALRGPKPADEVWSVRLDGAPGAMTVQNGLLFVPTGDNSLVCVDTSRGQRVWRRNMPTALTGKPCRVGDSLVISGKDGKIHFLDAQTGEPLWFYEAGGPVAGGVVVHENLVLFGSDDTHLYALDVAQKGLAWRCKTKGKIRAGVAVGSGVAYFMSDDSLYAVELN